MCVELLEKGDVVSCVLRLSEIGMGVCEVVCVSAQESTELP